MHPLKLITAIFAVIFSSPFLNNCLAQSEAVFFISSEEILKEKQVKLNTSWLETNEKKGTSTMVSIPYVWPSDEAIGMRTYYLSVKTDYAKPLGIELPDMYTSFKLYANNQLIAQSGRVSKIETNAVPAWQPQTVALPQTKEYHFKLEISNFHHAKGGIKNPIIVGDWEFLKNKQSKASLATWLLIGLLILLGIGINIYFWWNDMPSSALYFSFLCIVWAFRVGFSELYFVPNYFQDIPWSWVVHIEYLSLFISILLGLKFVQSLYPLDTTPQVIWVFVGIVSLFILSVILLRPIIFTSYLNIYLTVIGISLLYMVYIVARAVAFARYGATFSVFAVIAGLAAFAYNFLAYQGLFEFNPFMYNINYLIIFSLLVIAMFYQQSARAEFRNSKDVLTFDEYYKNSK